jgi:hypothetical protein
MLSNTEFSEQLSAFKKQQHRLNKKGEGERDLQLFIHIFPT